MTVELHDAAAMAQLPAAPSTALPPGFRFHPTDEELILHYLRKRAAAAPCPAPVIADVDIYKFDPWELPAMAVDFGEAEWYFFSPRDRKYPNGVRPNRAAASGYWKATGTDKPIASAGEMLGVKKALVFYRGRPPKGAKTSWIMHEYRLADAINSSYSYRNRQASVAGNKGASSSSSSSTSTRMRLDDWVLCRIYKKTSQQLQHFLPSMDDDDDDVDQTQMPRPPSISDYLVDYSTVSPSSELFHSNYLPLRLGLTDDDDTNKRQRLEDSSSRELTTNMSYNKMPPINYDDDDTTFAVSIFEPATISQLQLPPSHSQQDEHTNMI
ncbi:hypothetical protein GUJ93_ZPchr0001g30057 [Zizania palustris]|uniref:NAC domain-containing protein n=1 Tax=Zizania palustris TaxID=103762 RepID=A0A8J5VBA3_ZIZPA|nr:hypothetical protein GUJ93_ZPchr0001g30057 [Zizania palustris]